MRVTCIFWLFVVSLIELYAETWWWPYGYPGWSCSPYGHSRRFPEPSRPTVDFSCEENFYFDVGYGVSRCLWAGKSFGGLLNMDKSIVKSVFASQKKSIEGRASMEAMWENLMLAGIFFWGFLCWRHQDTVIIPHIILLLDLLALRGLLPRLAQAKTHETA